MVILCVFYISCPNHSLPKPHISTLVQQKYNHVYVSSPCNHMLIMVLRSWTYSSQCWSVTGDSWSLSQPVISNTHTHTHNLCITYILHHFWQTRSCEPLLEMKMTIIQHLISSFWASAHRCHDKPFNNFIWSTRDTKCMHIHLFCCLTWTIKHSSDPIHHKVKQAPASLHCHTFIQYV